MLTAPLIIFCRTTIIGSPAFDIANTKRNLLPNMKLSLEILYLTIGSVIIADADANDLRSRLPREDNATVSNSFRRSAVHDRKLQTELLSVGNNVEPGSLSACQGDCDDDVDCEV